MFGFLSSYQPLSIVNTVMEYLDMDLDLRFNSLLGIFIIQRTLHRDWKHVISDLCKF